MKRNVAAVGVLIAAATLVFGQDPNAGNPDYVDGGPGIGLVQWRWNAGDGAANNAKAHQKKAWEKLCELWDCMPPHLTGGVDKAKIKVFLNFKLIPNRPATIRKQRISLPLRLLDDPGDPNPHDHCEWAKFTLAEELVHYHQGRALDPEHFVGATEEQTAGLVDSMAPYDEIHAKVNAAILTGQTGDNRQRVKEDIYTEGVKPLCEALGKVTGGQSAGVAKAVAKLEMCKLFALAFMIDLPLFGMPY